MNCKKGDLAIIFRGRAFTEYIGHVVQCVELVDPEWEAWMVERSLDGNPDYWIMVPDSCLRPLRDKGVEDEVLAVSEFPLKIDLS